MLDRAYRISSDWSYFPRECDRLETVFLKLKYPKHLFNLAVEQFRRRFQDSRPEAHSINRHDYNPPSELSYHLKIRSLLM